MDALKTLLLTPGITTRDERIQSELAAKELLRGLGINTQDVIDHTDEHMLLDRVPGRDLLTVLQQADPDTGFDAGYRKAKELQTLHDAGHAYVDCRCSNTIIDGDTVYTIDHELFEQDASRRVQVLDLVTLLGTAKQLPPQQYQQFLNGFRAGYTEDSMMRRMRAVLELPCATGYALVAERDVRGTGRVVRNWVREHVL